MHEKRKEHICICTFQISIPIQGFTRMRKYSNHCLECVMQHLDSFGFYKYTKSTPFRGRARTAAGALARATLIVISNLTKENHMNTCKRMSRKQAEIYIRYCEVRLQKFASMLMDNEGTDVLSARDAAKALLRDYPNAGAMNSNELQWKVNGLLAQVIPDAVRKFVHVEEADGSPRQKSNRSSDLVATDLAEIAAMLRCLKKQRLSLLGI
jgi:hypothetical protein